MQNTSEATTNAQDEALNANCGAPATNASVWYTYSPHVDRNVVLMPPPELQHRHAGLHGDPNCRLSGDLRAWSVGLRARAGKTYNIMVISDTNVNGGSSS